VDALFWILSGIVAGCLVGIVILWRRESQLEKRLAAQRLAEGESSARLPAIDPLALLEREETRPLPIPARPAVAQPISRAPAIQIISPAATSAAAPAPQPFSPALEELPTGKLPVQMQPPPQSAAPPALEELPTGKLPIPTLEALPTGKLPTPVLSPPPEPATPPLEELPTGKLPAQALPPPAPDPAIQTPAPEIEPAAAQEPPADDVTPAAPPETAAETAPASEEPFALNDADLQEIAAATPERARLRLAELARERGYLEQTLESHRATYQQLQRRQPAPDSEEYLALHGLQSEIAHQQQRIAHISALEGAYRQRAATWVGQAIEQAWQPTPSAPKAFGARRLSRAPSGHAAKQPPERPSERPTEQKGP
jgi:DNA-directed RNA polymerase subunit K/omega